MSVDDFFEPSAAADIVGGRYRLPHPETGVEQSWTRVTTHASALDDGYALTRWQLRELLRGLRHRPDLVRLVESWADEPTHAALDAVITAAHEVAGTESRANVGTALHEVLRRVDQAWADLSVPLADDSDDEFDEIGVPEWALLCAQSYVIELRRHGLTPVPNTGERRVINTDLSCAGTIDGLYREANGHLVMGDKKTGRLDYSERKFAIQLALYLGATHMLDPAGGPPIDLATLTLRRDYAVLVHIDPEQGGCTIYRVDTRRGQYGANLAAEVRAWRRQQHLILPYVMPTTSGIVAATTADTSADTSPATTADTPSAATSDTVDGLMQLGKPELQRVLRSLDPTATLTHHRRELATKIVQARERSSSPASTGSTDRVWPALDPRSSITDDPTDPRSPTFHREQLREIASAQSVSDLGRIHDQVVRCGGDQAWTDELTAAARARTAELDRVGTTSQVNHITWRGASTSIDAAIRDATSSREMAQVWNLATLGGSVPEAWTAERNEQAHARLAVIDAALEAANPFD